MVLVCDQNMLCSAFVSANQAHAASRDLGSFQFCAHTDKVFPCQSPGTDAIHVVSTMARKYVPKGMKRGYSDEYKRNLIAACEVR